MLLRLLSGRRPENILGRISEKGNTSDVKWLWKFMLDRLSECLLKDAHIPDVAYTNIYPVNHQIEYHNKFVR